MKKFNKLLLALTVSSAISMAALPVSTQAYVTKCYVVPAHWSHGKYFKAAKVCKRYPSGYVGVGVGGYYHGGHHYHHGGGHHGHHGHHGGHHGHHGHHGGGHRR